VGVAQRRRLPTAGIASAAAAALQGAAVGRQHVAQVMAVWTRIDGGEVGGGERGGGQGQGQVKVGGRQSDDFISSEADIRRPLIALLWRGYPGRGSEQKQRDRESGDVVLISLALPGVRRDQGLWTSDSDRQSFLPQHLWPFWTQGGERSNGEHAKFIRTILIRRIL